MSAQNPATSSVTPRHLGLTRRQSYDPSTKSSLTLGALPSPAFGRLPTGQRSVPAVESNRLSVGGGLSGYRTGGLTEAPRTPGGSLVVGSEVFGFGRTPTVQEARERWGNGSGGQDGEESDDKDGITPKGGEADPTKWPTDYDGSVSGQGNDFRMENSGRLVNGRTDSSDVATHNPYGSSTDARTNGNLPQVEEEDNSAAPPSDQRLNVSHNQSSNLLETRSVNDQSFVSPSNPSNGEGLLPTNPYISGPPPRGSYTQGAIDPRHLRGPSVYGGFEMGGYQPPQSLVQPTPEDLAIGFENFNLGHDPYRSHVVPNQRSPNNTHRSTFPFAPYSSGDPSPQLSRQNSAQNSQYAGGYYYQQQALPYPSQQQLQEAYAAYPESGPFFQSADSVGNLGAGGARGVNIIGGVGPTGGPRRDSGYASSSSYHDSNTPPHLVGHPHSQAQWGIPVPPSSEYNRSSLGSQQSSRQGSFSHPSPAMSHQPLAPYGLASGTLFAGNATPAYGAQLARGNVGGGGRSSEYIAPGPSLYENTPSSYGGGYPAASYGGGFNSTRDDLARIMRSPMLEEFRVSRHRNWELSDIAGHVVEFSGDQLGSRHIQTKLESASAEEKQMVFDEILPNMLQLSTDVFANYVIQKFFEQGSQIQKAAMATVLENHVLQLSLQMYGCRVVQKALEYVLLEQQVRLIKELDGHVLKCARDAQSNHVVQRALERIPSEELKFITDACIGQVHALATHPYGCRVLQRIFENCLPSQTDVLLEELHLYTQTLIQDQYGNYVVQWVIEKGETQHRSRVIQKIYGQVLPLAQQKFASNVVEKCIVHATEEERKLLIEEVLTPAPADGTSVVKAMLIHPYANFVIQKILHTAVGAQREALFTQTSIQLVNLRKYSSSYSKHLIGIEKLLVTERARTY